MPRKSPALRLQQARELHAAYVELGIGGRKVRFVADMIKRMEREKYPTKRMRDWLDSLIEEGAKAPEVRNPELVEKMEAAKAIFTEAGKDWEAGVLADFILIEKNGWRWSEKQVALREKILGRVEGVQAGDHLLELTDEIKLELGNLVNIWAGYSDLWKRERPGLFKAVKKVRCALEMPDRDIKLEKWHLEKLRKSMGARYKQLTNPRWNEGDIGYYFDHRMETRASAICISPVEVRESGIIGNEWLMADGAIKYIGAERVSKR